MTFQFPDLRRPQYPSSPEILLSSLAWSVVPRKAEHLSTGLMYRRREAAVSRKVRIVETIPRGRSLESFMERLRENGIGTDSGDVDTMVAEAITEALLGTQPRKGQGTASSCVGVAGALLQDAIGGLAVANPPNFAQLINTVYALEGGRGKSAAEAWFDAARHFSSEDSILQKVERALVATTLSDYLVHTSWPPRAAILQGTARPQDVPLWWQRDVVERQVGTPFQWFAQCWDNLCSPLWYEVLSARRWASWAVCLLRNALGFTFLWEANFFLEIARAVEDQSRDAQTSARWAVNPTRPLLPNPSGSITQRDVAPIIKRTLANGLACRKALLDLVEMVDVEPTSIAGLIKSLRVLAAKKGSLKDALRGAGDTSGFPNLHETVRYSLLSRESIDEADDNALLRVVSRRFTHVSPGPEWIVVMSSMASPSPNAAVRLGDVERSLNSLGLQPKIDFLLAELERAGLCASAADGDQGIEINLGF